VVGEVADYVDPLNLKMCLSQGQRHEKHAQHHQEKEKKRKFSPAPAHLK
jgi:hypothetical protein